MSIIHYRGIDYGSGGSGGSQAVEISEDAYEALTEEQKKNGSIYFSPDGNVEPTIEMPEWIERNPIMHRNIFRGKYLGDEVTQDQLVAIVDGSFYDLYVGDYWTIPITIDNEIKNVNWRIADFDYWIGVGAGWGISGLTPIYSHHLVIVPDEPLYDVNTSRASIYTSSYLYTTGLTKARQAINNVFSNIILSHPRTIVNSGANDKTYYQIDIDTMSQIMTFGYTTYGPRLTQWNGVSDAQQLALFRVAPQYLRTNDSFWLTDITSNNAPIVVLGNGTLFAVAETQDRGVRPCFAIGIDNSNNS